MNLQKKILLDKYWVFILLPTLQTIKIKNILLNIHKKLLKIISILAKLLQKY